MRKIIVDRLKKLAGSIFIPVLFMSILYVSLQALPRPPFHTCWNYDNSSFMASFDLIGEYVEISCSGWCGGVHTLPIRRTVVRDVDYTEKYADTLNAMFDYEWKLLSVEVIYEEIDPEHFMEMRVVFCHEIYSVHARANQFIRWTIEYHDGNGELRRFVFHNRRDFSYQVEQYVQNMVLDYYRERFFDVYLMDESPVSIAWFSGGIRNTREYRSLLSTPEGAIRFAELRPAHVFEAIPFSMNITVQFYLPGYSDLEREQFMEDMIEALNKFANNHLNADINHIIIYVHGGG